MSVSVVRRVTHEAHPDPVRAFVDAVNSEAAEVKRSLRRARFLILDYLRKGAVARARKLEKIRDAVPKASVDEVVVCGTATLVFAWLEPHERFVRDTPDLDDGPSVVVIGGQVGRLNGRITLASFPLLEIPENVLKRIFQHAPSISFAGVVEMIYQAGLAFAAADMSVADAARRARLPICLPAGDGLFLVDALVGPDLTGRTRMVARAQTWISADMADKAGQRPVAAAADPGGTVLAAAVR